MKFHFLLRLTRAMMCFDKNGNACDVGKKLRALQFFKLLSVRGEKSQSSFKRIVFAAPAGKSGKNLKTIRLISYESEWMWQESEMYSINHDLNSRKNKSPAKCNKISPWLYEVWLININFTLNISLEILELSQTKRSNKISVHKSALTTFFMWCFIMIDFRVS